MKVNSVVPPDHRMMTRRTLLTAFGLGLLGVPLASIAQKQSKVWRVGFLSAARRADALATVYDAFPRSMRDLGYVEGNNLVIEWRFAEDKVERLLGLAAELVQLKVEVIVALGSPAISAAQKSTTTIPIVMGGTGDPVGSGFVKSLARPGGNITGVSTMAGDIHPKLFELLITIAPKVNRVAVLLNPTSLTRTTTLKSILAAAQSPGVKILPVEAQTPPEIESAFSMIVKENAQAVIVTRSGIFDQQVRRIAELATKYRLPSIYATRDYAEAGGLISYGQNPTDQYRRAATYVDRILKGARPGDLPVEQPTTFEMMINLKTAKALGLTIPKELLVRADKVIE